MTPKTPAEYREIVFAQAKVMKNLRDRMKHIGERAERTVNFCKDKGYTPSKLGESIIQEVEEAMFYLDNESAKLMQKIAPEEIAQTKLWEGHEDLKVRK